LPDPASWFFPMLDELPGPGSSFTLYCKTSFPLSLLPLPKPTRALKHSLSLSLSLSQSMTVFLSSKSFRASLTSLIQLSFKAKEAQRIINIINVLWILVLLLHNNSTMPTTSTLLNSHNPN
jgi:hypothetical protein